MMRLLFTGLAALAVLVAIALWWRPPEPAAPELVTQPPLQTDPAVLDSPPASAEPAALDSPPAEPAAPNSPPVRPERRPVVAATLEPASRAEPPTLLEPRLEEEALLVLVERPDFEDGPPGVIGALEVRQPLDPQAPAASEAAGDAPPARVDVDASGELIRRMLALYDAMRG